MTAVLHGDRPVSVVLRRVAIHSTSSIDARRLADGLIPALERALAGATAVRAPESTPVRYDPSGSGRAAETIAEAIHGRLREIGS